VKFWFFDNVIVQLAPIAHVKRDKRSTVAAISNASQTVTNRCFDFISLPDGVLNQDYGIVTHQKRRIYF
jgi:hypothetical protein